MTATCYRYVGPTTTLNYCIENEKLTEMPGWNGRTAAFQLFGDARARELNEQLWCDFCVQVRLTQEFYAWSHRSRRPTSTISQNAVCLGLWWRKILYVWVGFGDCHAISNTCGWRLRRAVWRKDPVYHTVSPSKYSEVWRVQFAPERAILCDGPEERALAASQGRRQKDVECIWHLKIGESCFAAALFPTWPCQIG